MDFFDDGYFILSLQTLLSNHMLLYWDEYRCYMERAYARVERYWSMRAIRSPDSYLHLVGMVYLMIIIDRDDTCDWSVGVSSFWGTGGIVSFGTRVLDWEAGYSLIRVFYFFTCFHIFVLDPIFVSCLTLAFSASFWVIVFFLLSWSCLVIWAERLGQYLCILRYWDEEMHRWVWMKKSCIYTHFSHQHLIIAKHNDL